jgi:cell division protein FtsW
VVLGLAPTKGLTLPFLSYGGSSFIASCLLVGLLLKCQLQWQYERERQSREFIPFKP